MADEIEMPPANLILQALHLIREEAKRTNQKLELTNAELQKTNDRLDALNAKVDSGFDRLDKRIDETNHRVDDLRVSTMQKLTDLNAKVDHLANVVEKEGEEIHELNERFDHWLLGEGAKLNKRVETLEDQMRQIFGKLVAH